MTESGCLVCRTHVRMFGNLSALLPVFLAVHSLRTRFPRINLLDNLRSYVVPTSE